MKHTFVGRGPVDVPDQPALAAPWADRVLVTIADRIDLADDTALLRAVAIGFADRFAPGDRVYDAGRPRWHRAAIAALASLQSDGQVEAEGALRVTASGAAQVPGALERLAARAAEEPAPADGSAQAPLLVTGVITAPLRVAAEEGARGEGAADDEPIPVMIELNLRYASGPTGAFRALERLWAEVAGDRPVHPLSDEYATGSLTMGEMKRLVSADAVPLRWPERAVYRLWPDFPVQRQVDASVVTVKADAALRAFNADGSGIVWAVIDSGIDGTHPHFEAYDTLTDPAVKDLHRSFTSSGEPTPEDALVDEDGHGTHVAGIIAGGLAEWTGDEDSVFVTQSRYNVDYPAEPLRVPRTIEDPKEALTGVAPRTLLVSLKVLGGGGPLESRVSRVIQALAYVREVNAGGDRLQRIHGVNLSVGYDFDPTWFSCGSSPLCQEVDKVVRTGVVVVVAAGNSGFGTLNVKASNVKQFGIGMTINDPGNAESAITVGSTHRDSPHSFGVSYFSSKGPTGDGRMKPDLVAPGERITSAAAGRMRAAVSVPDDMENPAVYVDESGTSMAAPHVSGVAAAFLSVRHEFIGKPDELKEILMKSATPLGRERSFEGAGLVDIMRALQSV